MFALLKMLDTLIPVRKIKRNDYYKISIKNEVNFLLYWEKFVGFKLNFLAIGCNVGLNMKE
jgi:hypothetical protein